MLRALNAFPNENTFENAWMLRTYLNLRTTARAANGVVYPLDVLEDVERKWDLMAKGTRSVTNYTLIDGP